MVVTSGGAHAPRWWYMRTKNRTGHRLWTSWSSVAALGVFVWQVVASSPALAYPVHARFAKIVYGKTVPCAMCHGGRGGTERNAYGDEWRNFGETLEGFKKIEHLDSDGDGASNAEEISVNSNPGSKRSTPARPGRYAAVAPAAQIPGEQLRLVMGRVDEIQAAEPDLNPKQIALIENRTNYKLQLFDRYPTVYFGVEQGKKTSLALFSQVYIRGKYISLLTGVGLDEKVKSVIIFRSDEDEETAAYTPFLKCLQGHSRDTLPKSGEKGCPKGSGGKGKVLDSIALAVKTTLWTINALYGKQ